MTHTLCDTGASVAEVMVSNPVQDSIFFRPHLNTTVMV